jgi:predicted MFS family arabinose efflux permease
VAFGLTTILLAADLLLIGSLPIAAAAIIGTVGFSLTTSMVGTMRGLLSQEIVQPRWHSATSAINILGMALGWGSMAILGGMLIGVIEFSGLMVISAACALASAVLIFSFLYLRPGNPISRRLAHAPAISAEAEEMK